MCIFIEVTHISLIFEGGSYLQVHHNIIYKYQIINIMQIDLAGIPILFQAYIILLYNAGID